MKYEYVQEARRDALEMERYSCLCDVAEGETDGDEARVAWRIGGASGNGLWFPAAARKTLDATVAEANSRYGAGTHWVEIRQD